MFFKLHKWYQIIQSISKVFDQNAEKNTRKTDLPNCKNLVVSCFPYHKLSAFAEKINQIQRRVNFESNSLMVCAVVIETYFWRKQHFFLRYRFTSPSKYFSINPLQPGVASLYPLKTSENLKVF